MVLFARLLLLDLALGCMVDTTIVHLNGRSVLIGSFDLDSLALATGLTLTHNRASDVVLPAVLV